MDAGSLRILADPFQHRFVSLLEPPIAYDVSVLWTIRWYLATGEKGKREIEEEGGKKKKEGRKEGRKEEEGKKKNKKWSTPHQNLKKILGTKTLNTLCGRDSCPEFIRGAVSQPVQLLCRQPREAGHHSVHMRGQS